MISVTALLAAGTVVFAGALVQGAAGFGLAMVAAPLLALIDPALVPAPLLALTAVHAVAALVREVGDTDWRGVAWAMLGRVPGTVAGVTLVVALPPRVFAVVLASIVLACVALSVTPLRVRPTRRLLVAAGVVSGVSGTAASVGGPPVALLYQSESGPRIRATLAAYFALGTALSLGGLALGGAVTGTALLHGAVLVPFLVAGFLVSGPARRVLDRGGTRPVVIALSAVSALVLLAQALSG
ncbi:MAG: sulfite exporter TauE/SafE family protein [Actinomycetota bacterium]|nr:sulfite exporter TauE/SafE family protein [Actinomycetota bacterium]